MEYSNYFDEMNNNYNILYIQLLPKHQVYILNPLSISKKVDISNYTTIISAGLNGGREGRVVFENS